MLNVSYDLFVTFDFFIKILESLLTKDLSMQPLSEEKNKQR